MKRLRALKWSSAVVFGGFVVLAAMWIARDIVITDGLRPPKTVSSVATFQGWRGGRSTEYYSATTQDGPVVIALVREHMRKTLASGPACYVFDSSLRLKEHCLDIGEDPQFQKRYIEYLHPKNKLGSQAVSELLRQNR